MDNNGYGIWGHIFRMIGAHTDTLSVAPTAANLAKANVYIVVDPDNEKESPSPNYPQRCRHHGRRKLGQGRWRPRPSVK